MSEYDNCEAARQVIARVPLEKLASDMDESEIKSINHYLSCKACRDLGLENIHSHKMTCQEAMLVWAKDPKALWMECSIPYYRFETLDQLYAVEHVWGKYEWENSMGGHGFDNGSSCGERSCRTLHHHWKNVPMSTMAGDGPQGVIHQLAVTVRVFKEAGWKLNELFELIEQRRKLLEESIRKRETIPNGHYNSLGEMQAELDVINKALITV